MERLLRIASPLGLYAEEYDPETCRLDRIGGGPQLRELGRQIAALNQFGVTPCHLERGLLAFPPEAHIELVLADAKVLHGKVRQPRGRDGST